MTRIAASDLHTIGRGLHRPECVIPRPSGDVFVPDWRGGVTRIGIDGSQETWLAQGTRELRPNGIAVLADGSFLVANLGPDGGVWRLHRDGRLVPYVTEVDGIPLPGANFVHADDRGRVWMSFSTRHRPRQAAWRPGIADGFIVLADSSGARIVADGLHYTNEVRPHPSGDWLYAVETFGRRLVRFPIASHGRLGARETVVTVGHGCFPDGFAFDEDGRIWMTSLISNRLLLFANETVRTILEDVNAAFVEAAEEAFLSGTMRAEHLGPIPGIKLQQLTSVGFGGPDGRTVFLGTLHGESVYWFRPPASRYL